MSNSTAAPEPWHRTPLSEKLGLRYPLIQAAMAGGISTPAMAARVSEAGGLGSLAGGYLTAQQTQDAIAALKSLTSRPFSVNLFVPEPPTRKNQGKRGAAMLSILAAYRREVGLGPAKEVPEVPQCFEDQVAVLLDAKVPVVSFTFGIPPAEVVRAFQRAGVYTLGTATTVEEGRRVEQAGLCAVVAQGYEAGGHRGTFAGPVESSLVGTMALVPQLVSAVAIPVVAAGGIMDGRGIAAARALGAAGAQMGTAFLRCAESGASPAYQRAVAASTDESTVITRAFSGKAARSIANRFSREMKRYESKLLPYPLQNAATRELRQAANQAGNGELVSLLAGQAAPLAESRGAEQLVKAWVEECERVLRNLAS